MCGGSVSLHRQPDGELRGGSGVIAEADVLPGVTIVLAGTLDDPTAFKPTMDVYWSSAQPWVHIGDERTKFPKMPT
jgi:hypothetical protein